jgi:hypothetical protein
MPIIWLVPWSPGVSAATQIAVTAKAREATPTARVRTSPLIHSFSTSTTTASTTMAARFITPRTTNSAISDQQQPRQYAPWWAPARTSRPAPR